MDLFALQKQIEFVALVNALCKHLRLTHTNLNTLLIPATPAYLTSLIDIVRLRQRQFCGRVRFTYHSICFDHLDLPPFASVRSSERATRLLTYVSGSTFIFGVNSLYFISFLPIFLQFLTTSIRLRNL